MSERCAGVTFIETKCSTLHRAGMCGAICDSKLEHCAMCVCVARPSRQLAHLGGSLAGYFFNTQWTITFRSIGWANVLRKLLFSATRSRWPEVAALVSVPICCISEACHFFLHLLIKLRCSRTGRACRMVRSAGSSGKIFLVILSTVGCISFNR